jgi:hypothetical protein
MDECAEDSVAAGSKVVLVAKVIERYLAAVAEYLRLVPVAAAD